MTLPDGKSLWFNALNIVWKSVEGLNSISILHLFATNSTISKWFGFSNDDTPQNSHMLCATLLRDFVNFVEELKTRKQQHHLLSKKDNMN